MVTDPTLKVTIFTNFSEIAEAYSLNRVVQDQLKMLLNNGYKPNLIVAETFEPKGIYTDERITIKRIPIVPVHNEVKKDESFDDDVASLETALKEVLKDTNVVLSHDIIYQPAALKHNVAARRIAKDFPNIKWLHWIHSATSPMTLNNLRPHFSDEYVNLVTQPFPNSKYVFFNHYSVPRIADEFGVTQEDVRVVHHPSDIAQVLGLTKDVKKFMEDKRILEADAVCVYPIRLDRGKQVQFVIKTMAALKDFNMNVKVIIVDFHSTGGDKLTYRDELKQTAIDCGLNQNELIWTSEYKEEWSAEVPHEDTMSIMRLGNVFIMPSVSESYSLITQEAGINKSVMVLNFDFPPFRDIFGFNAIYRKFSSNIDIMSGLSGNTNTQYGPASASPEERKNYEKSYHHETAGMIAARLNHPEMAMSMFLRKYRNLQTVFKNELEHLLYES